MYVICKMCNGKGEVIFKLKHYKPGPPPLFCMQCSTTGYVTWIDEILGRNKTLESKVKELEDWIDGIDVKKS